MENKERLVVKEISAKYKLWLEKLGKRPMSQEFCDTIKDLIESDRRSVGAVFKELLSLYSSVSRIKADKRFELEREIRLRHNMPISHQRIKDVKAEVYDIIRQNHKADVTCALVDTETHIHEHSIGESKIKEMRRRADHIMDIKLIEVAQYLNIKSNELESACNLSAIEKKTN